MRTELARVQTEAQKQSFERNGFEEYEFIANGDCCPICQGLHGKHYKVAKLLPGTNAPPMHPHCRCSTAAYSDRADYDAWLAHLEKGGTTEEWERYKDNKISKLLTNVTKSGKMQAEKFNPSATIEEAEEYAKRFVTDEHWAGTGISYKGIELEAANAANEALAKLYARFDIEKLGGVFVAKGNTKLGQQIAGAQAAFSPVRKSLLINNKSLKNLKTVAKAKVEELAIIKKVKENPASVAFKTKRAEDIAKASVKSGRATVPETIEDIINHEMGHAIEGAIQNAENYGAIKANMPKYAESISGYATANESEYIAESFASWLKGEKLADKEIIKAFETLEKPSKVISISKNTSVTSRLDKISGTDIKLSSKQIGRKIGKHAQDFGLDPSNEEHRQKIIADIKNIVADNDEVRAEAGEDRQTR